MRVGKRSFMMYLHEDDAKNLDLLAEETSLSKTAIITKSLRLYHYAQSKVDPRELDLMTKLPLRQDTP